MNRRNFRCSRPQNSQFYRSENNYQSKLRSKELFCPFQINFDSVSRKIGIFGALKRTRIVDHCLLHERYFYIQIKIISPVIDINSVKIFYGISSSFVI